MKFTKTILNKDLAELCGIIIGDGNLHKISNLITIVGSLDDKSYYENRVIPLFETIFNKKPFIKRRKDRNSYYLMIEVKNIMDFLIQKIGMARGPKLDAKIPKFIFDNKTFMISFLRGLFDTDGNLNFSKQNKKRAYYPRVRLCGKSYPMIEQIQVLLDELGFRYCNWKDKRSNLLWYELSGKAMLEKWMRIINPRNPIHITKFMSWRKIGYRIPNQTLSERIKFLNSINL